MICNKAEKKTITGSSWDGVVSIITQWLFIGVFVLGALYLAFYTSRNKNTENIPESTQYLTDWSYRVENGTWEDITLPCSLNVADGQTVEYRATLPDNLRDNIWLVTLNSRDFIISIDGVNRYSWKRDDVKFPGGPAKSIYMFVPLSGDDAGKTITIIKHGKLNNGVLKEVVIGDSLSTMNEIQRSMGITRLNIAIFLFIIAMLLLTIGITLRVVYKQEIYLIPLSMAAMATSAWVILDSLLFQLAFDVVYIDGFLAYVMCLIMIFPYILYIDGMQNHRYRRIYAILSIIEILNFIICTTLHLSGAINFIHMLPVLNFIIACIIVVIIGCIVLDVYVRKVRDYILVAIGVLVFGLMAVIEIITINAAKHVEAEGTFVLIGLFALMTMAVIQQTRDIQDTERRNREVEEASKAKQQFLTNMSHEIRTPINTILGMNEMILSDDTSEEVRKYAERISHSGKLLLSLINDVLDFSLYQTDKETITNVKYDIRSLVEDVVDVLRTTASEKDLGVNIGLTPDVPSCLIGDPKHIMRILNNVISNAVKYTDKGSITFSFECEKTEEGYVLEFVITDTGRGIRKEDFDKIFEPFIRSDIRKNRSIDGTGLGLAITKEIIEKMNGSIEVDSALGKGSTFTIRIPQGEVAAADVVEEDETCECSHKEHDAVNVVTVNDPFVEVKKDDEVKETKCRFFKAPNARVLAVDDNNSNLVVIREFLKSTGIQLDVVTGGQEAIDKCNVEKYDIIFMDHMMPDPDGIVAMHAIKEGIGSLNRTTPIAVLTANAVCDCEQMYLSEGFDEYLSKPIARNDLLRTIRKFINPKLIVECDEFIDENESITNVEESDIIDFVALGKRFDNQTSVINMVLGECVREGEKKLVLLQDLYDEGDIARYAIEAHGVKGVMASICANNISERAKKHEFAAKANDLPFVSGDIKGFLEQYRETLDYITDYLAKRGVSVKKPKITQVAIDGSETVESLKEQIEEALDEFDAEKALGLIDKLKIAAGADKEAIVEEIRQYADDFQYDFAKESLEKL